MTNWSEDNVKAYCNATDGLLEVVIIVRQAWANLEVSMIQLRGVSLQWVNDSESFWKGPNARKFRESSSSYIAGALDVPVQARKQLPRGVARKFARTIVEEFKSYEVEITNDLESFRKAAGSLFDTREQLARLKNQQAGISARLQNRHSPPSPSFASAGSDFSELMAAIENLEIQESEFENRLDNECTKLQSNWGKLSSLRRSTRRDFGECFRTLEDQGGHFGALLESLEFRVLQEAGIRLDTLGENLRDLVDSPAQVNFGAEKDILKDLGFDAIGLVPGVVQSVKHYEDLGSKWFKLKESRNFGSFGVMVSFVQFAIETGVDITENNFEEICWIQWLKANLNLPNDVFEQFFRKDIEKAFFSNLVSEGAWNAIKATIQHVAKAVGARAGAPGSLLAGYAVAFLLEEIDPNDFQQLKLERGLEDAVARGFVNWKDAEAKEKNGDPLLYQLRTPTDPHLYVRG